MLFHHSTIILHLSGVCHIQLVCCYVAQRKGVLDLYGEQALKAGMAENESGVAAGLTCYSCICMPQQTPQLILHASTDITANFACLNRYWCVTGSGWTAYTFDAVSGPEEVFSYFFGTSNPYEALNGTSK